MAVGPGRRARPHLPKGRLRARQEPRAPGHQAQHFGCPPAGRPSPQPVGQRLPLVGKVRSVSTRAQTPSRGDTAFLSPAAHPGDAAGGDQGPSRSGAGAGAAHRGPGEHAVRAGGRHGLTGTARGAAGRSREPPLCPPRLASPLLASPRLLGAGALGARGSAPLGSPGHTDRSPLSPHIPTDPRRDRHASSGTRRSWPYGGRGLDGEV